MSMLFALLIIGGDTLTLTNGEIFVGKVVARNEQRLWLKLDKGGVLAFPRDRIASIEASAKDPPASGADRVMRTTAPSGGAKTPAGSPPAAGENPGAGVRIRALITQEDIGRYALKCPAGFEKHATVPPPLVCVLKEPATGAWIALSAESFRGDLEAASDKVRAELGAGLLAEQEFMLRNAEMRGRLFESEVASEGETRGELQVVFVRADVLFRLGGSVRKDLLDQYRDLFHEVFTCFTLAPKPAAGSAGPPPAGGTKTEAPGGAPPAAADSSSAPPKNQP